MPDAPARPGASPPLEQRASDLRRLADERWDLVVVGGGIVGAGALLDAASRGLRVALVEQDDIAAGTSSRSSRLIHGGLRYLQQLRIGLVREALAERARLLRLAPHLVRLETFLFPLYGAPIATRAFYETGMTMYDVLGSARSGGRHRHLSTAATLDYAPNLRRLGLRGALVYHDAMEDDARYTLAVVRTALEHGRGSAIAVTRLRAAASLRDRGRVTGAALTDVLSGTTIDVRAGAVLDATGVWGSLPDGPLGSGTISVLPSLGSHLVVPRDRIPARGGMTLRIPGRVAFLVPWPRHWLIGTTDKPYHGAVDRPAASAEDVEEILGTVNGALDIELSRDDVVGTYAGLRPLIAPSDSATTVKVSREHRVSVEGEGLVRVSGGKYTTYRVMAADAVDAVLGPAGARRRPSTTAELPILGAADASELLALAARLGSGDGIDPDAARSLVDRHGTKSEPLLADGAARGLNRPLIAGLPYLESEVTWAVEHELALTIEDVLVRRFRLAPELRDRGASVAPRVAELMGPALGWDDARRASEVGSYLDLAHRQFDVPA